MTGLIIKVFGERNTGTRAVGAMLAGMPHVRRRIGPPPERALDGRVEAAILGQMKGNWRRLYLHALRDEAQAKESAVDPWKHAAPKLTREMVSAGVRTILMHRNPYSWFLSFARRPYHLKGPPASSLEAFLHRPWMTERREGVDAVLASPMQLWSVKLAAAERYRISALDRGLYCEFMSFEEFLQSPRDALERVLLDMHVGLEGLAALPENTKRGDADAATLAAYYRRERWKADLTAPLVKGINALVDWELAARRGYAALDPADFSERLPEARAAEIAHEMSGLGVLADRSAGLGQVG
ncbi:MAG: hypothetical protein AAFY59_05000 [Pseudomonadota bacterium]